MIRQLYSKWYVRIPLKMTLTLTLCKLFMDGMNSLTFNSKFGIPRTMDIYLGQNPINPPITQPYPYGDSYEHIKDIKQFEQYQRNMFNSCYRNYNRQIHILNDHPCRQNVDAIDNFIEYGNMYRIKQYINYTFINKLKSQGIQIPESINQRIRQLQQYRFNVIKNVIVPQL